MDKKYEIRNKGFTLVEVLVSTAVFLIISLAAYNAYISVFKLVDLSQYRVLATALANEQFEIAHNMPYSDVGIINGVPSGKIANVQNLTRGGTLFTVTTTIRNIDIPFDGTFGGSPGDTSPADNKLIEVAVSCSDCRNMQPITLSSQIAPRYLESASSKGAFLIQVFDSNGQPVQGASVNITHTASSTIVINDVTDDMGVLRLFDIPPAVNAYRIMVTKAGYSTDRTYATSTIQPFKPDATVLAQLVTQISFSIDELSTLTISSVTPTCSVIGNFDFSLVGAKYINATTPKYAANLITNGSGIKILTNMEWDTYTLSALDTVYDLIGLNPLNPLALNPNSSQNFVMIVAPKNPQSLLITIKDDVSKLPIYDAEVNLTGPVGFDETFMTGRGYLSQTNWSAGSGQQSFSNQLQYWSDDGNIETSAPAGDITLRNVFSSYNPSGWLESSTFDTGSDSNFYSLIWSPTDQPALAGSDSVRMQFATSASTSPNGPWNFIGPDGTASTYYTSSNSSLHSSHVDDQYARYRLYLSTADSSVTPNVSDVSFTFTSECVPPGQVLFGGLVNNEIYVLYVDKPGYVPYTTNITVNSAWAEYQVLLTTP